MKYKLVYRQPLPLKDGQKLPAYEKRQEIIEGDAVEAEEKRREFLEKESVTYGLITFCREQITFMPTLV